MKRIAFFSRVTFICNIAFLLFAFLNTQSEKKAGMALNAFFDKVPFIKELVIVLGFSAFLINIAMCIAYGIFGVVKKKIAPPVWLTIANFILLLIQLDFYFLYSPS